MTVIPPQPITHQPDWFGCWHQDPPAYIPPDWTFPSLDPVLTIPGSSFVTKDSGQCEEFETGAKRDTQDNKPRYDLIPVAALKRLAMLYARGAQKYGEGNFEKGMSFKRVLASLLRHVYAFVEGEVTEDHLAAVAWNAFALMFYQEQIKKGKLPAELNDLEAP